MKPSIRHSWAGPLALMVGLLLAQVVVYASTGWRDGFSDGGLWSLKRLFLRTWPLTLALAAGTGWILEGFHGRWLEKQPGTSLSGWPLLLAVLRLFLHFPFYGFIFLLQLMVILGSSVVRALFSKDKDRVPKSHSAFSAFMDSTALWMLVGPMSGMTDSEGEKLTLSMNPSTLLLRAPWLFPCLLLVLWIWTGAEGEESGERVNAFWLSLAGMVWLGDFLLLAWMGRPKWLRP